jgi:hypothetical protein
MAFAVTLQGERVPLVQLAPMVAGKKSSSIARPSAA